MKKKFTKYFLYLLQIFFTFGLSAQNLVPNPNFDIFITCPTGPGQVDVLEDWYSPTGATPDYFNACYSGGLMGNVSVPANIMGYQDALSGHGYVGIEAHNSNGVKEYIQTVLTEPLVAGECYEVEMFANAVYGTYTNLAVNHVGIYISVTPPMTSLDGNMYPDGQFFYPDVVTDVDNWVSLSGTYLAGGGEQYITIGNFFPYGYYNIEDLGPPQGETRYSYYFIENVRVEQTEDPGDRYKLIVLCEGECYNYLGTQYCDEGTHQIPINGNCNDILNLVIYFKQAAIADVVEPEELTCYVTSVLLDASNSSGGEGLGFSYEWTGPNNFESDEQSPVVSNPGIYTLTVDGSGIWCPTTITVEVFETLTPPEITAEADGGVGCVNFPVALTGTSNLPNVTYNWSGPGVNVNTPIAYTNQMGTYTFTVTTVGGACTSTQSVTVLGDFETPDVYGESVGVIDCNNWIATLIGSSTTPNVTYHWIGPGANATTPTTLTAAAGYHTLIVTAPNGCTSSIEVNVESDLEPPDIAAEVIGNLDCENETVTLSGSSETQSITAQWTGPGLDTNQLVVVVNQVGIYTLTLTGPNGCTSTEEVEVIEENAPLDIEAAVDGILDCENETVTLTGNSNTSNAVYEWSGPGGIQNGAEIQVDQPGEYTLLVSNGNGCSADTTILVEQFIDVPNIAVNLPDTLNCIVFSVDLDASNSSGNGSLNFEWQDAGGDILGTDSVLNVNSPGTYTLILTDSENGCSEQSTIEVFEDSQAPVSIAETEGMLDCQTSSATLNGSNSTGNALSFQWLNANDVVISTDISVDVSTAGIYTLLLTNTSNGCTSVSETEIELDVEIPTAIAETEVPLDCNNTEATLDGNGSDVGANILYQWQNPGGDSIANTLQTTATTPGMYTLIVFNDENGCSSSASVEVLQDISTPVAVAGNDDLITCDETSANLDGSASSVGSGALIFQWTNSNNLIISNLETAVVNGADIYTLTVFGENGCSDSDEVEVTLDTNVPLADAGDGGTLDCAISSIALGGGGTSGGNNIVYQWLNESNQVIAVTATTQVNLPGIYTLIVTDISNDCSSSAAIEIQQDIQTPTADAGNDATLNCLLIEAALDGSQSSSGPNFEYQWLNSNNNLISNDISTSTGQPDTYTLIVSNTENNCTAESAVVIDQNTDTPIADAGNDGVLTCGVDEVSLDGSNSSGNNLSFEWLNGSGISVGNQAIIPVSQSGIYTLIVTNTVSGCTAQANVEVTPDTNLPTAIATADDILTCEILEVIIDGSSSTGTSGNLGFEWLDGSGNIISTIENAVADAPGIYTLIVTDTGNGCSISTTIEIEEDIEAPVADAGVNQTLICGQTELTLDGSGSTGPGLAFEWQDDNGSTIATTAITTVASAGTYFVFVTNTENGCSASDSVEIIPDVNLPTADAGSPETLTCEITQITLDGSASSNGPNFEYQWQNSNGDILATTQTTTTSLPGTYTLFVLDTDNDCLAQDAVTIDQNTAEPQADAGANQTLTCTQTLVTLTGSGSGGNDLAFEWFDENQVSIANSAVTTVAADGNYTLIVTNLDNGCTNTAQMNVSIDTLAPTVVIGTPDDLTCVVENVLLDGSASSVGANFSYQWLDANSAVIGTEIQQSVSLPGSYTLVVTNIGNGCESQTQAQVLENTTPPIAIASTDEQFECFTESVALDGNGSSAGPIFTYLWTGNGTIDDPGSLSPSVFEPGLYTLLVTNLVNGCTQTADVLVELSDEVPSAADIQDLQPPCFGDVGSINILSVTGGDSPYLYSIDGGESFSSSGFFNALNPGTYDIVIQDAKGCEYEDVVVIESPLQVNVFLEPDVELELGADYQLDAISGIPLSEIDTIIWSPVTGLSCTNCLNPSLENIIEQIEYMVTIINENGCEASDRILLRVDKTREIFIPNAFSPNDDGTNDRFIIFANAQKIRQVNTFQIFDRWGEQVFLAENFQPNDLTFGWDGALNGEKLNPAVFVYFAEIEFIDGVKQVFKGDVALVK